MNISNDDLVAVVTNRLRNKFGDGDGAGGEGARLVAEFLVEEKMITAQTLWPELPTITQAEAMALMTPGFPPKENP